MGANVGVYLLLSIHNYSPVHIHQRAKTVTKIARATGPITGHHLYQTTLKRDLNATLFNK